MENNSSFKFKLVDIIPYVKGDKHKARIICYCSYGFVITLYVSEDKANRLKLKSKEPNFDMTNYVSVFYDSNEQRFAYVINNKLL